MGFWAQSPESSRLGPDDYTSFSYAGTATLELDDNPSDGITGSVLWDQMSFEEQRDVRYVALCRGGGGHHRDNLIIDAVNLQVRVPSGLHFSRTLTESLAQVPFGFDATTGRSVGNGC